MARRDSRSRRPHLALEGSGYGCSARRNKALLETSRRRKIQKKHNEENGIIPTTIKKQLMNSLNLAATNLKDKNNDKRVLDLEIIENDIEKLKKQMLKAAENLEFEKAAKLRDTIDKLQKNLLIIS